MARGLSLVEILVVLLVISLLAAFLYGGVSRVGFWGRERTSCAYSGVVYAYLADAARRELRSPREYLEALGLPPGPTPPGQSGSWWDCGGNRPWGRPPAGTQCAVRVDATGGFQVATWRGSSAACLNGTRP